MINLYVQNALFSGRGFLRSAERDGSAAPRIMFLDTVDRQAGF